MQLSNRELALVFKKQHEACLRYIHLFMNRMYHAIMFNGDEAKTVNEVSLKKLKQIEQAWMNAEKGACFKQYNCDLDVHDTATVEMQLKKHPVFNHPLFDYLNHEANLEDIRTFVLSESVLNLEFFDYLALSIIGVSDEAKAEIIANLWDEAGRGNVQQFHTNLFRKLLTALDLKYKRKMIIDHMSWEGLAGINLFSCFSLYAYNKTKYFGLLAATEMLDPFHYEKVINGMVRVFPRNALNHIYYIEHKSIDIEHANGWLSKIIIPELKKHPKKTKDFWLGFYLRLNSAQKYYDCLLQRFLTKQVA